MFRRFAPFAAFTLTAALAAACAAPTEGEVEPTAAETEDELREGGCILGSAMMPNLYDMEDVPEFTRRSSARFSYSAKRRLVSNPRGDGELGCESFSTPNARAQCAASGFTAKDVSWGPRDEASGRILLTVSNGGGGFQLVEPSDFYYCSASAARRLPPRIVLKSKVHVALSPGGFDPAATPEQIDAQTSAYCKPGTFDRQSMSCLLREGVLVEVSSYVKTAVPGEPCAVLEGTPADVTVCQGNLTCEGGQWVAKSCATRASSSRSFCARQGYCKAAMEWPAVDSPCADPAGTPDWSAGCAQRPTAGAPVELTCQDGYWAEQSCASRASSSRSYCAPSGFCESR